MTPSSPISLSSGTQYWIMVSPGATDTWAGWYVNNTGWTGLQLETNNLGGWGLVTASFSAFEVQGNTPEPASGALLAFGAVALSALRLRKKRKSQ
jgi:hypothetical protein